MHRHTNTFYLRFSISFLWWQFAPSISISNYGPSLVNGNFVRTWTALYRQTFSIIEILCNIEITFSQNCFWCLSWSLPTKCDVITFPCRKVHRKSRSKENQLMAAYNLQNVKIKFNRTGSLIYSYTKTYKTCFSVTGLIIPIFFPLKLFTLSGKYLLEKNLV